MKKYYLFDFDGTMVDSLSYWHKTSYEFLSERNLKPADDFDEVTKSMGYDEYSKYYKELYNIDVSFEEIRDFEREKMKQYYKNDIKQNIGVTEVIKRLKSKGCKLAILTFTESSLVKGYLERVGLLDNFEFILSGADTRMSKTEREIYLTALDMLKIKASDVVYVEDSVFAIRVAKSLGIETVGVYESFDSEGTKKVKKEADYYINNFLEFDESKY